MRDAAEFLEELVRIPSLSGDEAAASAWLVARMRELGFSRAGVDEAGNAVGEMGDGKRLLMLLGHIDTVPGEVPVRRAGGKLHGRGSVDAKGPLAAFTLAVAAAGARPGWKVVVAGAVEEEAATSKGARHLVAAHPTPEACIIGEPSGWQRLCMGYKGRLLADCRLVKEVSHTAGKETSACEDAVDYWNAVRDHAAGHNRSREKVFDQLSPSLRSFTSTDDGLRQTVEARIGLRLPVGLSPESLRQDLLSLAAPGMEIRFSGAETGLRAGKSNPLVRAFLGAIRRSGGRPGFVVKTGTSDMNVVGPAWSCPILAYGPGDSSLDHTPDEHIDIEELKQSIGVLETMLRTLTG